MEFKSFSTSDKNAKLDLISSQKRILNKDLSQELNSFGHLIDREFWGIAHSVKSINKPLYCYKLISDTPKTDSDICEFVQKQATFLGEQIYSNWKKLSSKPYKKNSNDSKNPLDKLDFLHITTSQKRTLNKLLKNKNIEDFISLEELKQNGPSKKTTNLLIEIIEKKLDPKLFEAKESLNKLVKEFNNEERKISFSQNLESTSYSISGNINENQNIEQFINSLKSIDHNSIQNVLEGTPNA